MFNIFKKKTIPEKQIESKTETILCIPGNWADRESFITSIFETNINEYLAVGFILFDQKNNLSYEIDLCVHDSKMRDSFKWAGLVNRIPEEFLDKINQHKFVVYLKGETGNFDKAKLLAEAGRAVLNAGGIGIKIETTGKAFTKEHWLKLLDNFEISNLYEMFVIDSITNEDQQTYSCGMHNLGLKDTIVYDEEFQTAVNLISIFNYYQIIDKPEIKNNQTFSIDTDAPIYTITEETNQPNKGDKYFENKYGMWRLNKKNSR